MDDVFRKWAWTRGKEGKVLTRLTWTGSALFVTLAAASAAAATPGPGGTAARNDLQRRVQSSQVARNDHDAGATIFSGPACEVPDHDSGNHLGWVKHRQNGLIGGSYGEVFFANGAGTRAVASIATGVTGGAGNGVPGASAGGATTTPGSMTTPGSASATGSSAASVANTAAGSSAAATGLTVAAANASPTALTKSAVLATGAVVTPTQQAAVNPEPATLILLGTGLGTALFTERRRRRSKK